MAGHQELGPLVREAVEMASCDPSYHSVLAHLDNAYDWIYGFFTDRWPEHVGGMLTIETKLPTYTQIRFYGLLGQADGVRACKRLFRMPYLHDEMALAMWARLREECQSLAESRAEREAESRQRYEIAMNSSHFRDPVWNPESTGSNISPAVSPRTSVSMDRPIILKRIATKFMDHRSLKRRKTDKSEVDSPADTEVGATTTGKDESTKEDQQEYATIQCCCGARTQIPPSVIQDLTRPSPNVTEIRRHGSFKDMLGSVKDGWLSRDNKARTSATSVAKKHQSAHGLLSMLKDLSNSGTLDGAADSSSSFERYGSASDSDHSRRSSLAGSFKRLSNHISGGIFSER